MAEIELLEEEGEEPAVGENPLKASFMKNVGRMERPMPGQSLTNDPENPLPFEQPPKFVDKTDALEYLFASFVEEKKYIALMGALEQGLPIMDLTTLLLVSGFQDGLWNYDLLLILIEPTAYMIMALAERAGIDYKIYSGEGREEALENKTLGTSVQEENIKRAKKGVTIPKGALPKEIVEQIEEMPVDSLLAKKESSLLEE